MLLALERPKLRRLFGDWEFVDGLKALVSAAELVRIGDPIRVCRDPDDDKFLEVAVYGSAECIVSGDRDLLDLHPFRRIPIYSPSSFLAIYE